MTSPEFLAALHTQLAARFAAHSTLSDVTVYLWETNPAPPAVVLVRDRIREETSWDRASMGPRDQLDVTVPALVGTKGDWQAAADQATAIVAEIRAELAANPPPVGGTRPLDCRIDSVAPRPFNADEGGTIWDVEVDIIYTSSA